MGFRGGRGGGGFVGGSRGCGAGLFFEAFGLPPFVLGRRVLAAEDPKLAEDSDSEHLQVSTTTRY